MSAASRLLERLEGVRPAGPGRWMARSPLRPDRRPSLSIRELDDGRVLINDFGGGDTAAILSALGLTLADLFDKPLGEALGPVRDRGHFHAQRAALEALRDEARVLTVVAADAAVGRPVSETDAARVAQAAGRIASAVEALYGRGR